MFSYLVLKHLQTFVSIVSIQHFFCRTKDLTYFWYKNGEGAVPPEYTLYQVLKKKWGSRMFDSILCKSMHEIVIVKPVEVEDKCLEASLIQL